MKTPTDKSTIDLDRLIDAQNFQSEEEVRKFFDSLIGHQIPPFPKEKLGPKEQAQDLVFEAYDLSPAAGRKKIQAALKLDQDCVEAYEYLASISKTMKNEMAYLKRGIDIGRRIFGGQYLKEHKGGFWGFHETRPFMRCLQKFTDCLCVMGLLEECVEIFEEMIELNPLDNQGVRHQLMLYLIHLRDYKKYEIYARKFKDDVSAYTFYNNALFTFKSEGNTSKAIRRLKKAIEYNNYVPAYLLSIKKIKGVPVSYSFGDDNEAMYYTAFAFIFWKDTEGALDWLKNIVKKDYRHIIAI
jgi:pentatricopeptide repeat protein